MGSATTDKTTRQRLRQRLLQAGEDPEIVEIAVEALRARQGRVQVPQGVPVRRGAGLASTKAIADARARFEDQAGSLDTPEVSSVEQPDDKGYRPNPGDGLLTGPGRAQGVTARVVRRRNTVTRWEWEQLEAKQAGKS